MNALRHAAGWLAVLRLLLMRLPFVLLNGASGIMISWLRKWP